MTHLNNVKLGDYVIASRWPDSHPNDPWAIGFVSEFVKSIGGTSIIGVIVVDENGNEIPGVGRRVFRHAYAINKWIGKVWTSHAPDYEMGQNEKLKNENENLRRLLATTYHGIQNRLYVADGEPQDNRHPAIDFEHDSVETIAEKMQQQKNYR